MGFKFFVEAFCSVALLGVSGHLYGRLCELEADFGLLLILDLMIGSSVQLDRGHQSALRRIAVSFLGHQGVD